MKVTNINMNENAMNINIEIDEYEMSMLLTTLETRICAIDDTLNENDVDSDDIECFEAEKQALENISEKLTAIYNEYFEKYM